jgi:hypothetical protein
MGPSPNSPRNTAKVLLPPFLLCRHKIFVKGLDHMTYEEKRAAERAADLEKPFLQRQEFRKDHMYRGWMLEPVIDTFGDRVAITRSNYGYRVLNTPDLGMVDVDFNRDWPSTDGSLIQPS